MATTVVVKPKERQFQVVPVPAVFTRGRWECSDFKDANAPENQILEFPTNIDRHSASTPAMQVVTNAETTAPAAHGHHLPPAMINPSSSAIHFEVSPAQSIGSTDTFTHMPNVAESHTVSVPTNVGLGNGFQSSTSAFATTSNPAAIDNKIEQAMDLVKTHLTFAVREEVEILRSTILDLETKVNILENENQLLRQLVPQEVIQNMPLLIQNAKQQHHKPQL